MSVCIRSYCPCLTDTKLRVACPFYFTGDWYGPSTVSTILEKACQISHDFVPLLKQVCLYVAHDCTIYKKDVIDLATGQ